MLRLQRVFLEDTIQPKPSFPHMQTSMINHGIFYEADQTSQSFPTQLSWLCFHARRPSTSGETSLPSQIPIRNEFVMKDLARGDELVGKMLPAPFQPGAGGLLFPFCLRGVVLGSCPGQLYHQTVCPWPSRNMITALDHREKGPAAFSECTIHRHCSMAWFQLLSMHTFLLSPPPANWK